MITVNATPLYCEATPLHYGTIDDTMESATISIEQAKVLADHYLALARYWRQIAKLPPVITATGQRKMAERECR